MTRPRPLSSPVKSPVRIDGGTGLPGRPDCVMLARKNSAGEIEDSIGESGIIFDENAVLLNGTDNTVELTTGEPLLCDYRAKLVVKTTSTGVLSRIAARWASSPKLWFITHDATDKVVVNFYQNDSTTNDYVGSAAGAINDGDPHTIEVMKMGKAIGLYIDGVQVSCKKVLSAYADNGFADGAGMKTYLGSLAGGSGWFPGTVGNFEETIFEKITDVIVIAGQSNAVGAPEGYGDLPVNLQGYLAGAQINSYYSYCSDGAINEPDTTVRTLASTSWGVEITMSQALYARDGRRVLIVKVAKGSTSLAVDWAIDGQLYNDLVSTINTAISTVITGRNHSVGRKTFVWIHGETDAYTQEHADAYLANFDAFKSSVEEDSISFDSVVITRLNTGFLVSSYVGYDEVRAAQAIIGGRSGNVMIDTDALEVKADGMHYSSAGLMALGELIAANITVPSRADVTTKYPLTEGATAWTIVYGSDGSNAYTGLLKGSGIATMRGGTMRLESGALPHNYQYGYTSAFVSPGTYNIPGDPQNPGYDMAGNVLGQVAGRLSNPLLFGFLYSTDLDTLDTALGGDFFFNSADSDVPLVLSYETWTGKTEINNAADGRVDMGPKAIAMYSTTQVDVYDRIQRYIGN